MSSSFFSRDIDEEAAQVNYHTYIITIIIIILIVIMTIIITIRKFIARLSMKMIKRALSHRIKTNPKTRKFTVVC